MCGIFGVLDTHPGRVPDRSRLDTTVEILDHRGPDDRGVYVDDHIGLAFTRLALLDLNPRSSQPFWDESGRYCLAYNGEIYNFISLREKLQGLGLKFHTTSDTEVVLQSLLNVETDEALRSFEGMFAIALWDRERRHLTLARDRFGIKPMFIAENEDRLLFTSEIQALRPWMDLREDKGSIVSFLYGSGGPTIGRTFFAGVSYLTPGSVLTLDTSGHREEHRFHRISEIWDPAQSKDLETVSDEKAIDEVDSRLSAAVEQQLVADAPVGALCSGGVDSSLIMAMARRAHGDLAVFHANVLGPSSEYEAASSLARHLDLDLRVAEVRDHDFLDLLPRLTRHHGNPYHMNPHAVPFYLVSQVVQADGVKAVLSGEGADEVFLGYSWLSPGRTQRRTNKVASHPSTTLLQPREPSGFANRLASRLLGKSRNVSHGRQVDILTAMLGGFEVLGETQENSDVLAKEPDREVRLRAAQSLDLLNSNLRGLLHRNDTMGMASSIESRFPFLDSRLVSFGINLRPDHKIRRGFYPNDRRHPLHVDKWILRKVADRYLPRDLSRRPKRPFSTSAYQRMSVNPTMFHESYVTDTFGLSQKEMNHFLSKADSRLTAKLVHLEVWGSLFMSHTAEERIAGQLRDSITFRPVG